MRVRYKDTVGLPPPPAIVAIATMTAERVELYRHVSPPGQPIPNGDQPFLVDYSIPEDKYITWALHRLCLNRLGGPLEMQAEHLHQWLIGATWDDTTDATNWQKVVAIVQAAFRDGMLDK